MGFVLLAILNLGPINFSFNWDVFLEVYRTPRHKVREKEKLALEESGKVVGNSFFSGGD